MSSNLNQPALINQKTGQQIPLQQSMTIGRKSSNSIVIKNDTKISREHVRISLRGNGFIIEDLGSANGSYVNRQRLTGVRILENNDVIRIGKTELVVQIPAGFNEKETHFVPTLGPDFNESPTVLVEDEDMQTPLSNDNIVRPKSSINWFVVIGMLVVFVVGMLVMYDFF
jgi:pSer/pThr/pTyr-binding forkhead associated (FHA) protein